MSCWGTVAEYVVLENSIGTRDNAPPATLPGRAVVFEKPMEAKLSSGPPGSSANAQSQTWSASVAWKGLERAFPSKAKTKLNNNMNCW